MVRRQRASALQRRGSRLKKVALGTLIAVMVIGLVGTVGTMVVVAHYDQQLPSLDRLGDLAQISDITDRNGEVLARVGTQRRTVVPLDKISPNLRNATIAIEDRTFYQNEGVDYRRLAITAFLDVTHHSTAGGSTITQQLVKQQLLGDTSKTADRKIKELLLTEELQRRYPGRAGKDQILALYLNTNFYGHTNYGVEEASKYYFGVGADKVDVAEAALLAGIPQSPSRYDPFGNPDQQAAVKARWHEVLKSMVETKSITPAQEQAASSEDIWGKMNQIHAQQSGGGDPLTGQFVAYVLDYLQEHPEVNASSDDIRDKGLRITTTLDMAAQRDGDRLVKETVKRLGYAGVNTGAMLAMDSTDGEILAMIGSADPTNDKILGKTNLATTFRSAGSTMKPYTYATALQAGLVTPATLLDDQNEQIDGHTFHDYDGRTEGMIPLRRALTESRNLPAQRTYKLVGGTNVISFAKSLGVDYNIGSGTDPNNTTITLGTADVRMIQHVAGYAAFANGGYRILAHPILKVTDLQGNVKYSFDPKSSQNRVRAISPELAYLVANILDVRTPNAAQSLGAQFMGQLLAQGRPVMTKSGTTESYTNAWWMGSTPNLTVGAMVTHLSPSKTCDSGFGSGPEFTGTYCPTNGIYGEFAGTGIFQPFVLDYYKNHPWPADWVRPAGIVTDTVCRADGNLAGSGVPDDQKFNEIFIRGKEPNQSCVPPSPSPVPTPPDTHTPSPVATPTLKPSFSPPFPPGHGGGGG